VFYFKDDELINIEERPWKQRKKGLRSWILSVKH